MIEICEGAYASNRYTPADVKDVMKLLAPEIKKITSLFKLVGSSRRNATDTFGDIDLLVANTTMDNVYDTIEKTLQIVSVPRRGSKVMSLVIMYKDLERQLEVNMVDAENFGAASLGTTGSNEFNIALRSRAKSLGLMLNNYGLFNRDTNERIAGKTEAEVFKALNLPFIEPADRALSVSNSFDLFRRLDKKKNEILDVGVALLANREVIQNDYNKVKDWVNKRKEQKANQPAGSEKSKDTYAERRKAQAAQKSQPRDKVKNQLRGARSSVSRASKILSPKLRNSQSKTTQKPKPRPSGSKSSALLKKIPNSNRPSANSAKYS